MGMAKKVEIPSNPQLCWIVEFRKGWLSQHVLKTFDNSDEAYAYEAQVRKDERDYLRANPDVVLETNTARR